MKKLFLFIIRFYQTAISVYTPAHCRYYPTCSSYAYTAISRFGVWRGGLLAILRILRCHPFHPGGYDPVPEKWDFHYYKKQNSAGTERKDVSLSRDREEHSTCN